MRNLTLHDRPKLLMLSHALPRQTVGNADASPNRRAWQLLSLAHRTHNIYLAAVADGPVNLSHWRAAKAVASQIVLIPSRTGILRWLSARHLPITSARQNAALTAVTREWSALHAFDMVLCTEPGLLDQAALVDGAMRILDLAATQMVDETPRVILPQLRRRRKASQLANLEQRCIRLSDAWITTSEQHAATFQGRLHPRLVLDRHRDVMSCDTLAQILPGELHLPTETVPIARAA
ncbi:MAG: hypothetical protein WD768_02555 [Phycisphaeraceae bacterium]